MTKLLIVANPNYFKKRLGLELGHHQKYESGEFVTLVADNNVPETSLEPAFVTLYNTEYKNPMDIYAPYMSNPTLELNKK